jgi:hypothetical protein
MSVAVLQAHRVVLNPTRAKARDLERHTGAARFTYNWALAPVRANIGQRAPERSYGLGGEDLTLVLGGTQQHRLRRQAMSFKITHKTSAQELPFPTREAAEAYAEEHGGGLDNWTVSMTRVSVVLSPHQQTRASVGARTSR